MAAVKYRQAMARLALLAMMSAVTACSQPQAGPAGGTAAGDGAGQDGPAPTPSGAAQAATMPAPSSGAARPGGILDFMTMDVCTDSSGRAVAGVPGDGQCARHRDIRPGEAPSYVLGNFGIAGGKCGKGGTIVKTNTPVVRDGVTRLISTTVRTACAAPRSDEGAGDALGQDGASIQWADDRYGFIMGSYSPVSLSAFQSGLCNDNPKSSRRFFRSWVIGPAQVPAEGQSGTGIFDGAMAKGASRDMMGSCPARYRKAFTAWTVQPFPFKSGRALTAIMSSRYAQASADGKTPGEAMQMERTYWTAEFGLSRWEKWTREDYARKDGKAVATLAGQLAQRDRCSMPKLPTIRYSASLQEVPGNNPKLFTHMMSDPGTGRSHRWLMTLCEDYTNVQPASASGRKVPAASLASAVYWAP